MKTFSTSYFTWHFPDSEKHFLDMLSINPEYQMKIKHLILKHRQFINLDYVLDIGANVGLWTRWFAAQQAKKIECFEPIQANIECLQINTRDLPTVNINPIALSNYNGNIDLYTTVDNTNTGTATIHHNSAFSVKHTIPCVKLDDLKLNPTFIKIDVQGAELIVFEGGKETIARCKPAIITECENDNYQALDFLREMNYEVVDNKSSDFLLLPK